MTTRGALASGRLTMALLNPPNTGSRAVSVPSHSFSFCSFMLDVSDSAEG
jgi:hypothetical protein